MFNFEDDDILTLEQLNKMLEANVEYRNNEYLKYLIDNQIIVGISYGNFNKILEFISKKDIYNVYDCDFLNLLCKNLVLLYGDIDEEEIYEPEEEYRINKLNSVLKSFYDVIDNGNLKKFDTLINILMGNNNNPREKIKLMIDTISNFKKYIPLADEIIQQGGLSYREKYALIELLKFEPEYYEI